MASSNYYCLKLNSAVAQPDITSSLNGSNDEYTATCGDIDATITASYADESDKDRIGPFLKDFDSPFVY